MLLKINRNLGPAKDCNQCLETKSPNRQLALELFPADALHLPLKCPKRQRQGTQEENLTNCGLEEPHQVSFPSTSLYYLQKWHFKTETNKREENLMDKVLSEDLDSRRARVTQGAKTP